MITPSSSNVFREDVRPDMNAGLACAKKANHKKLLTLVAPAKINLYLGVRAGRDTKGYHRVDSVMVALGLADQIVLSEATELSVNIEPGVGLPAARTNVWKAAKRLAERFDREPRVRIEVLRHIPMQAGLGGSSSDAGTTLRCLCALWEIDVRDPAVIKVAQEIGADVPFFLDPRPSYLNGRGDTLEETFCIELPERSSRKELSVKEERSKQIHSIPVVLVKPKGGVSTGEAYADFDRAPVTEGDLQGVLAALRAHDLCKALALASNNLDPIACRLSSSVAEVKKWLGAQSGVTKAVVCGSGSCVWASCENAADVENVAAAAKSFGWWSQASEIVGAPRMNFC